jgi:hypothetical protein
MSFFMRSLAVLLVAFSVFPLSSASAQSVTLQSPTPVPTLMPPPQQLLMLNGSYYGGFEGGAVTHSVSDAGWIAVGPAFIGPNGYIGEPSAKCGEVYGVIGYGAELVTQKFIIPSTASAPHFTLLTNIAITSNVVSPQTLYLDVVDLTVRTTPLLSVPLVSTSTAGAIGAWTSTQTVSLSGLQGHTVQLHLRVSGAGSALFNVDDASVLTSYPQNILNLGC